ncbi:hypothetical protein MUP77_22725 [Candidatus Bathyarchaeota archaeon]|nr:hypothetical protein [Candidatus Bathyarchaeota archaeon]
MVSTWMPSISEASQKMSSSYVLMFCILSFLFGIVWGIAVDKAIRLIKQKRGLRKYFW